MLESSILKQETVKQKTIESAKFTENYEGIKTLKELNFQNKEKIYFNRPANEPFKFFSSRDKSFGILISKRDRKEKKKNNIYIFDIESEKMRKIESECS